MSETAATTNLAPPDPAPEPLRRAPPSSALFSWTATILAAAAGVVGVAWVCRLGLSYWGPGAAWLLVQVPLALCTGSLAWRFAISHERKWVRPATKLLHLIEEVRQGQAPIDSLSEVDGPIAPLAASVQNLLRELRRQEQRKARMETEIVQHVRRRTDALQRKVASWQTQAFRDALTGLYNRRLLDEQLPKLLDQCRADDTPLSVLAVDLDNFKQVNDTHGHAAGDRLLRDIGQLISSALREGDLAFRVGGDEFIILLAAQDAAAAQQLARRLTSLTDQLAATIHSTPRAGLSIGLLCLSDLRNVRAADILSRSDAAMYKEKAKRKAKR